MRVKAVVAYDGTGYGGFQRQKNATSIQQELEQTLEKLSGQSIRILAAGRTDAGVHAVGQVVAFDIDWRHSLDNLQRGMNALLSKRIAVSALGKVSCGFHPRYDAVRRDYRYTISHTPVRNPLVTRFSLHIQRPLNFEAMQKASQYIVGRHDFSAFGSPPQGNNAVREVYQAVWSDETPWLYFDIGANAFLYRMVRMLVGTLLRVGYGALTVDAFCEILQTKDRRRAGPAVEAKGLCLERVVYADEVFQGQPVS
jgi:tRNA pseudouridine38-40 synthase